MEILPRFAPWGRSLLGVACLPEAVCMVQLSRMRGRIRLVAHAACAEPGTVGVLRTAFHTLTTQSLRISRRVALAIPDAELVKSTLYLHRRIPVRHQRAVVCFEASRMLTGALKNWHLDFVVHPLNTSAETLRDVTLWAIPADTLQTCTHGVRAAGFSPHAAEPVSVALSRAARGLQDALLPPDGQVPPGFLLALGLALRGMV